MATVISITWCNCFYNYVKAFIWTTLINSFKETFQICRTWIWKIYLGGRFWKVLSNFNWSKCFHFLYSTKLQQNIYLVKFYFNDIVLLFNLLTTIVLNKLRLTFKAKGNNSHPLKVVTKNFIIDATDIVYLSLSRLQYGSRYYIIIYTIYHFLYWK